MESQNAIGMMTIEEARAIAAFLPEPPATTRLCWTDWMAFGGDGTSTAGVSRDAFVFELHHGTGIELRRSVVMREWDVRRMTRAQVVAEAYRRMAATEEEIARAVPMRVAEAILKQARDSAAENERRGPEGFDYR